MSPVRAAFPECIVSLSRSRRLLLLIVSMIYLGLTLMLLGNVGQIITHQFQRIWRKEHREGRKTRNRCFSTAQTPPFPPQPNLVQITSKLALAPPNKEVMQLQKSVCAEGCTCIVFIIILILKALVLLYYSACTCRTTESKHG